MFFRRRSALLREVGDIGNDVVDRRLDVIRRDRRAVVVDGFAVSLAYHFHHRFTGILVDQLAFDIQRGILRPVPGSRHGAGNDRRDRYHLIELHVFVFGGNGGDGEFGYQHT